MRILVAEDDHSSAAMLDDFLQEQGHQVAIANDGCEAYKMLLDGDYRMLLSDWEMPEMTGVELCRRIRRRNLGAYVYVILVTSHGGTQNLVRGLKAGADDFVTKPYQAEELLVRVRTGERIASLESRDLVIFSMAKLAESRDPETGAHLERMREYSRILAEQLALSDKHAGRIDGDFVRTLYLTSPLHDIGKVGIPDSILLKPGRLTRPEFEVMQQHATIGKETLEAAVRAHPNADFLRFASDIAWSHHERYDGTGYPRRLAGEQIPLCGRIVALADVYDALTSKRTYKPAFSHEKTKAIILDDMATAFDPDVVSAFLAREEDFSSVRLRLM